MSAKQELSGSESEGEWIGPMPSEYIKPPKKKRKRVLEYEHLHIANLPSAEYYEKSYMHRDTISHCVVTKTDFIITASIDGIVKFWKKQVEGIEFVKTFLAHTKVLLHICTSVSGRQLATIATDNMANIFDVENFDMVNKLKLTFSPFTCEWIHQPSDPDPLIAISDNVNSKIYIYHAMKSSNSPIHTIDSIHTKPVTLIKYNPVYDVVVSSDELGMIEYWGGNKYEFGWPKCLKFESKLDTDLFEYMKVKAFPIALDISPNGQLIGTIGSDKMIRVFRFLTGKLSRVFDESTQQITEQQQQKQFLGKMEFSRRLAIEKEIDKKTSPAICNLKFDESSNFILYPTLIGVKVVNLYTNRLIKIIGRPENMRILNIALFQGKIKDSNQSLTMEMQAAENPTLNSSRSDPSLFVTAFKKNRFYVFSRRDFSDVRSSESDRDVFNEKPSKEDIIAATDTGEGQRLFESAILHTSCGDFHIKLFAKECPRTVENFCVHAKNNYFNGNIFHRVIKQFMIQTGDPLGSGVGGESIWGGEFEDEFHPNLKHDRPYTVSMANAGPNSNGSQFFITVVPAPWLDNKHTVFGRVTRGLEVVQNISNAKTNPKTDKPYDEIILISISLK